MSPFTQLRYEQLECRQCLAAIGFVEHAVERVLTVHAAGDLNGDGHADLVGRNVQGIGWRENLDGGGSFGEVQRIPGGTGRLSEMLVSDIDGDGDNDILVNQWDQGLVWYENRNGRGDFGPPRVIGEGETLRTFALADVDSDGDQDLVQSVYVAGGNSVLRIATHVDGLGTFETTHNFDLSTYEIQVYDVDQDGDQDIAAMVRSSANVLWLENTDGMGNYQVHEIDIVPSGDLLVLDDLDQDGNVDLVVGGIGVQRYEAQSGTVNFQLQSTSDAWEMFDLWTGDFDGDGDRDVIFSTEHTVRFLELSSEGKFLPEKIIGDYPIVGVYPNKAPVADLNSDGRDDVILGVPRGWVEYSSQGTFDLFHAFDRVTGGTTDLRLADLDSDGDLDIITVAWGSGPCERFEFRACYSTLSWNENLDGRGAFGPQRAIAQPEAHSMLGLADAIDVDGDGDLDFVHDSGEGNVMWYENLDGKANFGPPQQTTLFRPTAMEGPVNADVDADGDVDEVLFNRWMRTSEWSENLGGGDWRPWSTMPIDQHFALGDIDGDGDLDYVTGSWGTQWYENRPLGDADGDGRFTSSDLVAIMQSGKYEDDVPGNASFAEGDWNGDGDFTSADLVLALQIGTYERV